MYCVCNLGVSYIILEIVNIYLKMNINIFLIIHTLSFTLTQIKYTTNTHSLKIVTTHFFVSIQTFKFIESLIHFNTCVYKCKYKGCDKKEAILPLVFFHHVLWFKTLLTFLSLPPWEVYVLKELQMIVIKGAWYRCGITLCFYLMW